MTINGKSCTVGYRLADSDPDLVLRMQNLGRRSTAAWVASAPASMASHHSSMHWTLKQASTATWLIQFRLS